MSKIIKKKKINYYGGEISKPLLGKVALKIRHHECLGWSSIGMSETQFNRIATLEKKKIFVFIFIA